METKMRGRCPVPILTTRGQVLVEMSSDNKAWKYRTQITISKNVLFQALGALWFFFFFTRFDLNIHNKNRCFDSCYFVSRVKLFCSALERSSSVLFSMLMFAAVHFRSVHSCGCGMSPVESVTERKHLGAQLSKFGAPGQLFQHGCIGDNTAGI